MLAQTYGTKDVLIRCDHPHKSLFPEGASAGITLPLLITNAIVRERVGDKTLDELTVEEAELMFAAIEGNYRSPDLVLHPGPLEWYPDGALCEVLDLEKGRSNLVYLAMQDDVGTQFGVHDIIREDSFLQSQAIKDYAESEAYPEFTAWYASQEERKLTRYGFSIQQARLSVRIMGALTARLLFPRLAEEMKEQFGDGIGDTIMRYSPTYDLVQSIEHVPGGVKLRVRDPSGRVVRAA